MSTQQQDQRDFQIALGARLAAVRRDRMLTQEQVAESLGVDPQTVQRAEVGRTALSLARLRELARVLGVRLVDLFDEDEEIPAAPWEEGAARLVAIWSSIPDDRRQLAERVLREFSQH